MECRLANDLNRSHTYIYEVQSKYYLISAEECRACTVDEIAVYKKLRDKMDTIKDKDIYTALEENRSDVKEIVDLYNQISNFNDKEYNTDNSLIALKNTRKIIYNLPHEERRKVRMQKEELGTLLDYKFRLEVMSK